MRNPTTLIALLKGACRTMLVAAAIWSANTASAQELYNLDFSGAETGTYQGLFGNPSIESSVGPLTDALVFHAVSGNGEQIQLPIGLAGPRFDIQCDVLTHNVADSDYAFVLRLDTSGSQSVNFHGGLNSIYLFQSSPFLSQSMAALVNDSIYHVGVIVDFQAQVWSVAINGSPAISSPLNGSSLQAVRFGLAPWSAGALNAPGTFAALDNVVVAVPEPSAAVVAVAGLLVGISVRARVRID